MTWNCRGSSMMANSDSTVMAQNGANCGACNSTAAVRGSASARANKANGPGNMTKVTNTPTARNAISLTIDSAAIASIKPSWCSVASVWRVPNSTAKVAIASATNSATSPTSGGAAPPGEASANMVETEADTALSCSAM